MTLLSKTGLLALIVITLVGCDGNRECTNDNRILNASPIGSTAYNIELVRLINTTDEGAMEYYFDSYVKNETGEHIIVRAQGEDFCAKGSFLVTEWTGIENIQKASGKGYSGAELEGFAFSIDGDSEPIQLVFSSVTGIFD